MPRMGKQAPQGRTAVYRLYDQAGELLYIGKSSNLDVRWGSHAVDKPWWSDVVERRVTWYDSRAEATREETRAIRAENPRYNYVGTPRAREAARTWHAKHANQSPPAGTAVLDELAAIENPVDRFKAAGNATELARTTYMPGARKIREDAVNELRQRNMSWGEIGTLLGQHRNRVQQIAEGRTGGKSKPKSAKED